MKSILKDRFARGAAEVRTRILVAAANEFAVNGFRNSTVRDIAISADVNDVTVYRHFPSKQQLYWAALDERLRNSNLPNRISELIRDALSPEQLLRDISLTVLKAFGADPKLPRLINFTLLELEEERRLMYQLHFRSQYSDLLERMSDWIGSGAMRAVDPNKAALSLVGILLAECHLKTVSNPQILNPETTGMQAAEYADICIAGLVPQK